MTSEPWPLPDSWHWSTFAEVARVASDLVDPNAYPDMPHIAPNHIERETGRLLPFATVAEDGVKSAKHRFNAGQILYSKIRPYLAKVVVVDFDGLCSADMYPVETELDPHFLKWWMLTREFTRLAAGQQARTVLPKINKRALSMLPVPVPPANEERRIVSILEEQFSRLDAADQSLSKAHRLSELLRAATLESLAPEGTATHTLGDLATDSGYGTSTKCVVDGPGVPVVRIPNLVGGRVSLADEKRAADGTVDLSRLMLQQGDLLIVRTNGSRDLIGRAAVVQPSISASFASYLIRFRLNPSEVRPQWVRVMFGTPSVRRVLEAMAASSAGQYNLGLKKLNRVIIPCPLIKDQDRLLSMFDEQDWALASLTESLAEAKARGQSMRRSLLGAAFSGRLTGHNTDMEIVEEMAGV